jgi:hypothetical protein
VDDQPPAVAQGVVGGADLRVDRVAVRLLGVHGLHDWLGGPFGVQHEQGLGPVPKRVIRDDVDRVLARADPNERMREVLAALDPHLPRRRVPKTLQDGRDNFLADGVLLEARVVQRAEVERLEHR